MWDEYNIIIPKWYMNIVYNGRIIPNDIYHDIQITWANCQVYAYQLLRYNNMEVPDYRSKELWEDIKFSYEVKEFKPLDILFFNKIENPWWAHLGIYIWNNQVLHNSLDIGKPEVRDLDDFSINNKYKVLIQIY